MIIRYPRAILGNFKDFNRVRRIGMQLKNHVAGMAVTTTLLIMLGSGCASSPSQIQQPPPTSYMRSAVGTPNELSPQAPAAATNMRKVGAHWACEVNGRTMIYNDAASCWEPQKK